MRRTLAEAEGRVGADPFNLTYNIIEKSTYTNKGKELIIIIKETRKLKSILRNGVVLSVGCNIVTSAVSGAHPLPPWTNTERWSAATRTSHGPKTDNASERTIVKRPLK